MTPDPSVLPVAVWLVGPAGLDEFRLLVFVVVLGFFSVLLLLGAIAVSVGYRR